MLNRRSGAITFVFITVLLDMLALGIIVPVLPKLILNFSGGSFASAAIVGGIFGTTFALLQLVVSPILGVLSDQVGRRPVILLSNLGTGLDYFVMALAPNIEWLFLGRVISGVTTSSIAVASAYIADVTPPEKRSSAFGLISACFGVGFVVGPAVGGFLGSVDPRLPFWFAGAMSMGNFLYGALVLPESLAPQHRNSFSWTRANPFGALKLLRRHRELSGLSAVNFFMYVAHEALPQLFIFYTLYRYGWNLKTVGISLAVVGITTVLAGAFAVSPAVKLLGERRAVVFGLFCTALSFGLLAGNELLFWAGLIVGSLGMIASSAIQSIMTRRVEAREQGELQGAISMIRSVAALIGPFLFTGIFSYSISAAHPWHAPGAAMYVGAALELIAIVIVWVATA